MYIYETVYTLAPKSVRTLLSHTEHVRNALHLITEQNISQKVKLEISSEEII